MQNWKISSIKDDVTIKEKKTTTFYSKISFLSCLFLKSTFWYRVFLYNPGCPKIWDNPPASDFWMLGQEMKQLTNPSRVRVLFSVLVCCCQESNHIHGFNIFVKKFGWGTLSITILSSQTSQVVLQRLAWWIPHTIWYSFFHNLSDLAWVPQPVPWLCLATCSWAEAHL